MPSPTNLQTEWARLVVATLADAGVRDAVVSPGSRSTPYVLSLIREARMRTMDVIDERVAAFVALGIGRATGRPALLVCTSGTALAHYLPAVIEASESGIPLIVLSADRPPELHDAAANQTIRQTGIYGSFARWSVDLGVPEADETVLRAARRRVLQAVRAGGADKPGPVHLNAPARKPLEPPATLGPAETALVATVETVLRSAVVPVAHVERPAPSSTVDAWVTAVGNARGRGVIACGPAAADDTRTRDAVLAFAHATGFPVLAEAASGLRYCGAVDAGVRRIGAVDALLRAGVGSTVARPAMIVQVGRPLVGGGWERVAGLTDVRHVVDAWEWPDPDGTAAAVVQAIPAHFLDEVRRRLTASAPTRDERWGRRWTDLDRNACEAAAELLAAAGDRLEEGAVARALVDRLPDDACLALGNSLPVRHLDAWVPPADRRLRVLVQRGVSGIDGMIGGAVGAHRATQRPVALLLGDVSFVHDLGALATAPAEGPPLVIVVLDNQGGRIFEQLPVARRAPEVFARLLTPPRVDLALATAAFGVAHVAVARPVDLATALDAALGRPGTTVVQAHVAPHGAADLQRRLAERVAALVRGERA